MLHAESRTGEAVLEHNRKALAFIGQRDGLAGRNRNRAVYNEALVGCNGRSTVFLYCVNGLLQRDFFAFADICAIDSDRKLYSNTGRNRQRIRVNRNIRRACFNIEVGDIGIVVKCLTADGLQLAFALALVRPICTEVSLAQVLNAPAEMVCTLSASSSFSIPVFVKAAVPMETTPSGMISVPERFGQL